MNRVLLVGASGRVGRMVMHHWRARPSGRLDVVPQYRSAPPPDGGLRWSPVAGPGPLLDHGACAGAFDTMVMLAGVCRSPGSDLSVNAPLAEACLSAASAAGIGRVLLASSSAVYGPGDGVPFAEAAPLDPAGAYGRAKVAMEGVCGAWRARGMEICCLRIGNVAGADALLTNIAGAGPGASTPIDVFADGTGPVRSYIGARTLAQVLETLVLRGGALPDVLNVAAPRPVAMEALAQAGAYRHALTPAPPTAHQRVVLDCTALESLHRFRGGDGDPGEMIAQWRETLAP